MDVQVETLLFYGDIDACLKCINFEEKRKKAKQMSYFIRGPVKKGLFFKICSLQLTQKITLFCLQKICNNRKYLLC